MHDGAKEIARILADWAAGQSITVHLFGSRVRGDHKPDSDVDIYIQIERATTETTQWWTDQNVEDFATLKAMLPGPLKILEFADPVGVLVTTGPIVHRDRNVVCVMLPPRSAYPSGSSVQR